jgi:hypothetical protein
VFPEASSGPFGGCEPFAFLTLQWGCSAWPAVLTGFTFVGVFASIAPDRYRYLGMALLVLFEVSGLRIFLATGGISRAWPWEYYWTDWPFLIVYAWPILFGGVLALGLHVVATRVFKNRMVPGAA